MDPNTTGATYVRGADGMLYGVSADQCRPVSDGITGADDAAVAARRRHIRSAGPDDHDAARIFVVPGEARASVDDHDAACIFVVPGEARASVDDHDAARIFVTPRG